MSKEQQQPSFVQLGGKIHAFNISPKGLIEGAMVETPTAIVQVNFPTNEAESLARSMSLGSMIDLKVERESEHGNHVVYRMFQEQVEVKGTIVRLNYAHHGKENEFHLDNGTFVHVKPNGAKKYGVSIGDVITATGWQHAGNDAVVLEAQAVVR